MAMIQILDEPTCQLWHGDSRALTLAPNSVDSIVTDPPAGIGFMDREWDGDKGGREHWIKWLADTLRASFDALKPGGHALVWAIPRTSHWTMQALELVGFEIRDVVSHFFGSGFPKSMDISKAIDKSRDDRAEILRVTAWVAEARDAAGMTNGAIDRAMGLNGMAGHWTSQKEQPTIPRPEQFAELLDVIGAKAPDHIAELVAHLNDRKGTLGEDWHAREVIATTEGTNTKLSKIAASAACQGHAVTPKHEYDVTAPSSENAKKWEGFGTALKPAAEFWILCRKPIGEKNIATNVLKHGTGALNIDGCRIKTDDEWAPSERAANDSIGTFKTGKRTTEQHELGRWPANVTLDPVAAAILDEQGPKSKPKAGRSGRKGGGGQIVPDARYTNSDHIGNWPADPGGGVSRFYYVAKPSRAEKDAGLEHIAARTGGEATGRKEGSAGIDNPRAGAGRTGGGHNFHPTVKSQGLMKWLCRLITPPGGIVLDPFAGSGSTGVAAISEGFGFVGCEMTPEYIELTSGRLSRAVYEYTGQVPDPVAKVTKYEPPEEPQLDLFASIGAKNA